MTQETYKSACILAEYIEDAQRIKGLLEGKQVREIKLVGGGATYTDNALLGTDLAELIKAGLESLIKTRQEEFDSL